jgi:hypothetical protein
MSLALDRRCMHLVRAWRARGMVASFCPTTGRVSVWDQLTPWAREEITCRPKQGRWDFWWSSREFDPGAATEQPRHAAEAVVRVISPSNGRRCAPRGQ